MLKRFFCVAALLVCVLSAALLCPQQTPPPGELTPLPANAPEDKPGGLHAGDAVREFEEAIAPYVAQARATLPDVKKRFEKGLNKGEMLSVTIRLYTAQGGFEQVFMEVKAWKGKTISGLLQTEPRLVKNHKRGEKLSVEEKDVFDWTITRPDGSEEGNFVGKFLDTYYLQSS